MADPVEGIQLIEDITHQFGVEILEGRIGFYLSRRLFYLFPSGLEFPSGGCSRDRFFR
jgi:hypothetical protein